MERIERQSCQDVLLYSADGSSVALWGGSCVGSAVYSLGSLNPHTRMCLCVCVCALKYKTSRSSMFFLLLVYWPISMSLVPSAGSNWCTAVVSL